MKRSWLISMALILSLTTFDARAETIFGFLEGPVNGANSGTGSIGLTGWALADSGVSKVIIQVDGVDIGQAHHGAARPLIEQQSPGYPDSSGPGFNYQLNSTQFTNGIHRLSAKVITNDGNQVVISGTQHINFINNTSILAPFGEIDTPQRNAEVYGTCNLANPNRIYTTVAGWALDLGVEIGDAGLGYVELLLDGAIVANTRTGCFYSSGTGGLTNCYGLPRLDIERNYPFALDAPTSGFRFVMDIGALLNNGWLQGQHTLTIRAGDISNQVSNIDEIPVVFLCIENFPNEGSKGFIESPKEGRQYSGSTPFVGWAVDIQGVDEVQVFVDGELVGIATYGVDSRPQVAAEYPGYPDAAAPVWRLDVDTNQFSDGFHQVQAIVIDDLGAETIIGERTFFVNNAVD